MNLVKTIISEGLSPTVYSIKFIMMCFCFGYFISLLNSTIFRLEEYEEQLREYEHMNQRILNESQDELEKTKVMMIDDC